VPAFASLGETLVRQLRDVSGSHDQVAIDAAAAEAFRL